mgnify:CR=1 FL=1
MKNKGVTMKTRGFEIAKGWEDRNINLPKRSTKNAAGYYIEAAADSIEAYDMALYYNGGIMKLVMNRHGWGVAA